MHTVSVHEFQSHFKSSIEQVLSTHNPLRILRAPEKDVVVISAEDWEQMQETLYVLQNQSLMQQIAESLNTHTTETGYTPTSEELHEIVSL